MYNTTERQKIPSSIKSFFSILTVFKGTLYASEAQLPRNSPAVSPCRGTSTWICYGGNALHLGLSSDGDTLVVQQNPKFNQKLTRYQTNSCIFARCNPQHRDKNRNEDL